jgi:hypothetical protein
VDNQPGHHPPVEQDKPDADRFVAKVRAVAAEADQDAPVESTAAGADRAPSERADALASLAGAPFKVATGVLERLRDRL